MKVTWSDDSNSNPSYNEKHVAIMCFMTIESDNKILFLDDESNLSYNELHNTFEILHDEFKRLGSNYSLLKKSHACVLVEKIH
jgi:hypothetical protein